MAETQDLLVSIIMRAGDLVGKGLSMVGNAIGGAVGMVTGGGGDTQFDTGATIDTGVQPLSTGTGPEHPSVVNSTSMGLGQGQSPNLAKGVEAIKQGAPELAAKFSGFIQNMKESGMGIAQPLAAGISMDLADEGELMNLPTPMIGAQAQQQGVNVMPGGR